MIIAVLLATGCGSASGNAGGNNGGGGSTGGSSDKPSITVSVDKPTINPGDLATVTWKTTNATSLTISPQIGESDAIQVNGSATVAPTQTTTYVFTATNSSGSTQFSLTINVNVLPPTVTLSADPTSIIAGQSSTLSWNSQYADTVTIDNNVGKVSPTGTQAVSPTATTTYTATAAGKGGTVTAQATVTVTSQSQLAVTISANPMTIVSGQSSTLTWTSTNAATVTLNGAGVNMNGTQSVSPTQTTTYTIIAADGSGNTQTANVVVTVQANSGLQNLKHIIFYLNENRSFDNYFTNLNNYRASKGLSTTDVDTQDLSKIYTDVAGNKYKPFHIPTTCIEVTSPGWNETHFFVDRKSGGSFGMDFWVRQQSDSQHSTVDPHYTRSLGYYTEQDLPYYYELATQFATSDRWFASTMAPTIPNRMYIFTGSSFGHIRPDSPTHAPYTQKTIFQLLNEHGITWRYYYQSGDVYLAQFDLWNDPVSQGKVRNIAEYYSILADPNADKLLPQVVFIEQAATVQLNEHPDNKWGIQPGAANTKKIIDALMNSAAWPDSAFLFTYDEGGGLLEHVAPFNPPPPDSTPPNLLSTDIGSWDQFTYSGLRTPVIVVSPYAKKNFVSHTPRTTVAILKLIETRFGLPPLTARDAAEDDMTEFFDFNNPPWMTPPALPDQPWYCDQSDNSCKGIVQVLGPPPLGSSTCDLSHKSEVAPTVP
jgi:phospholipase C